jgi:electron-transferring-flavoprotein dehydrogenase
VERVPILPFKMVGSSHFVQFQIPTLFFIDNGDQATDLSSYTEAFTKSWVYKDLHEVRNLRPSFATKLGIWGGIAYSGLDSLFLKGRGWWTFRHTSNEDRERYTVGLDAL